MSNELVPVPTKEVASYEDVASSTAFLPRLQLMTSNSEVCKGGEFPTNHFALIQDKDHKDLGQSVDVVVCAWRPKSLDTKSDPVIESLDAQSEVYKSIVNRSEVQDSGCMHGPEYLVYIPELDQYATIFYGSKSARRESRSIHALLRKAATLKPKKIQTPKYTWYVCAADECSSITESPEAETLMKEIDHFMNPPVKENAPEADPDGDDDTRE